MMRFCETTLGCYFALLFGHNGAPDGIGYFVCSYGGELDAVVPHRYGVLRLVHGTAICRSAEIAHRLSLTENMRSFLGNVLLKRPMCDLFPYMRGDK